ncbi:hypothetical protein C7S18_03875 [Ahniella affigens]|uniref:Uncharacterized protein n=1 Tax=Ahniella affigens TaxID=2021234 RepID=A0A2P1PNG9_9GAMM|nr:DUF2167 domain-containing protein [Ahniella affigens]AVP96381.1 hypothetical protein C7S18_03875 [Ahniella affigens]
MIYHVALLLGALFLLYLLYKVHIGWAVAEAVVPFAAVYFLLGSLEGIVFWILCGVFAAVLPLIAIAFAKGALKKQLGMVAVLVAVAAAMSAKAYEIDLRLRLDDAGYRAMIQSDPALKARFEASPRLTRWLTEAEKYRGARKRPPVRTAQTVAQESKKGAVISLKGESEIGIWKRAMTGLEAQQGAIKLDDSGATIELPAKFKFIHRDTLEPALAIVKLELDRDLLGWIVHVDAPFDDRLNAWWVEVRRLGGGHVAMGNAATTSAQEFKDLTFEETSNRAKKSGKLLSFLGFPIAPWANDTEAAAAWVGAYGADGQQVSLCRGMALGRNDQIIYAMRTRFDPNWQELCFLSVKTLARHTRFEPGKTYADYARFSDSSTGEVADFISGARVVGRGL